MGDEANYVLATIIIVLIESVMGLIIIIGNSVVIYVMTREKKLRKLSNYHITSLAVADLLVGIVVIPIEIFVVIFMVKNMNNIETTLISLFTQVITLGTQDFQSCLALGSVAMGIFIVSIFSLLVVSIDRYLAVCHSSIYRNNIGVKTTYGLIAFSWTMGLTGFFPIFGWNSGAESLTTCDSRWVLDSSYIIFVCVTFFFIPTALFIVFYGLIYKRIRSQVSRDFYKTQITMI